jgi:hypothetical protein
MKKLDSSPPSKSRVVQVCLFLVRLFLLGAVTLVLLIGVAWAFGALWFDFPFSALRRPLAAAFGLGAIGALVFVRPRWRAAGRGRGCHRARGRPGAHDSPFQYGRLAAGGGRNALRRN